MADPASHPSGSPDTLAPIAPQANQAVVDNQPPSQKHRIKISGQEQELDLPDILKLAEKAGGADKAFQESAADRKFRQEHEAKLERIRKGTASPQEVYELLGDSFSKYSEEAMLQQMWWDSLSPQEQQAQVEKWELEDLRAQKESQAQSEQTRQAAAQKQESIQFVDKVLAEALEAAKADGIPVGDLPELAESVIDDMLRRLEFIEEEEANGRAVEGSFDPIDAIRLNHRKIEEKAVEYLKKLDAKKLKSLLSKEQLQALRSEQVSQLFGDSGFGQNHAPKKEAKEEKTPFEEPRKTPRQARSMSTRDAFDKMDKQYGLR